MTGSLCRHTAAIKVHGEVALSVTCLFCSVARQTDVLDNGRSPELLTRDTNRTRPRLAILPQDADIFFCCIQWIRRKTVTLATTQQKEDRLMFDGFRAMYHIYDQLCEYRLPAAACLLECKRELSESSLSWGGKKFEELPVVHIKATYNNTHIQLTDSAGESMVRTSCGTEGFKNIKKSTPVAAQTAGISAAAKATAKGVTFVRVVVKGLGPGRLSAIKGLTMGGLEVVSITDNTPVPHNGCRPRKARRT
ncbi:28S ribosomal protein S11, mitochondrial [Larimichthys crocea]|uniref:Uncharacterized protein n=1 Tax=Larimichthys crocea TaxID=215358 RepID=A0ACD3R2X2_LARCR|nr:28S ribosomal protein S11, mitochondrial [Larimichthys crocea]